MSAYLTAASERDHGDNQLDIKSPLAKLKDAVSMIGKVNQSISQIFKNLIKLSLPIQFAKLGEKSEEWSVCHFWDAVFESIDVCSKSFNGKI